jgi:Brp/Blh family beta-carotene 15,15'-monooxygenase
MDTDKKFRASSLFLYLVILVATFISFYGFQIPYNIQISIMVLSLAAIGLPHGATDAWLAWHYGLITTPSRIMFFSIGYIAISVIIVFGWSLYPSFFLTIFLTISVWHFGNPDLAYFPKLSRILDGLLIIGAPAAFSSREVSSIYETLSGTSMTGIMHIQIILFYLSIILLSLIYIQDPSREERTYHLIDSLGLVLLSYLVGPILYFTIFFCGIHSSRYMYDITRIVSKSQKLRFWSIISLLTFVTLMLGMILFWCSINTGFTITDSVERTIYIGLAALTFPHMLLVDAYDSIVPLLQAIIAQVGLSGLVIRGRFNPTGYDQHTEAQRAHRLLGHAGLKDELGIGALEQTATTTHRGTV